MPKEVNPRAVSSAYQEDLTLKSEYVLDYAMILWPVTLLFVISYVLICPVIYNIIIPVHTAFYNWVFGDRS
mgnify:CR=1 FL=1